MDRSLIQPLIDKAGGLPQLADALGVDRTSVYHWVKKGLPAARITQAHLALRMPLHKVIGCTALSPPSAEATLQERS